MPQANEKEWTVMIYFAADNELDSYAQTNLEQMQKIGSTGQVNVIAQVDWVGNAPTKRYYFKPGETSLDASVVCSLRDVNTGDPEDLKDFIRWGFKEYPANHYLVVLWGHGSGWDDFDDCSLMTSALTNNSMRLADRLNVGLRESAWNHLDRFEAVEGDHFPQGRNAVMIPTDNSTRDFLNNTELKQALSDISQEYNRKIDILGMDACLMSMAEVCYQVRDSVDLFVGSEQTIPNNSWPYDLIIGELVKAPQMTAADLSGVIVDKYVAYYKEHYEELKKDVTLSACDLTKSAELATAVGALGQVLRRALSNIQIRAAVMWSRRTAQSYYIQDYIDLYHFCKQLQETCKQVRGGAKWDEVQQAGEAVMRAIDNNFVLKAGHSSDKLKNSYGISIYFPSISPCYVELDFAKTTHWQEFLYEYIGKSLKPDWVDVSHAGEPTEIKVSAPLRVQGVLPPTTNDNKPKERIMADEDKTAETPDKIEDTPEKFFKDVLELYVKHFGSKKTSPPDTDRSRKRSIGDSPDSGDEKYPKELVFEVRVKLVSE